MEERIKALEERVSTLERQLKDAMEVDAQAVGRAIREGIAQAERSASCDKPQGEGPSA